MRRILVILLCAVFSGCGFHLRGEVPYSAALQNVYVQSSDPYGQLARNLRDYFRGAHIKVAESAQTSNFVLDILKEEKSQQLLSVGGTQQTRQYNLILTVTFQLTDSKSNIISAPISLSETRTFTAETSQILGGTNEANAMYLQMEEAMVTDIMNRLTSKEITTILLKETR
jgi:LPS-assembly lipoprotein